MSLGTQYVAQKGYQQLEKAHTYHVLLNDTNRTGLVSLVWFEMCRDEPAAYLLRMRGGDFEDGIRTGQISRVEPQALLPFWFEGVDAGDLNDSDARRRSKKKAHADRMHGKVEAISPAVKVFQDVLRSDDPDRILNSYARACAMKEVRFRLCFYLYLAFGKREIVLHYRKGKIGTWSRDDNPSTAKRGAPDKDKGPGAGYNVDADMESAILETFQKYRGLGVRDNLIYARAMVDDFGCRVRERGDGHSEYYHPDGVHFPSSNEYWDHVNKKYGHGDVRSTRIGKTRERSEFSPFQGSFSANVCNLMERVETDVYVMKECPKGLFKNSPLRPLRVCRRRDVTAGKFTGIGFSLGSEKSSQYRMARFCEAINKVKFCYLFGLTIEAHQWEGEGVCAYDAEDRGAGASPGAFSRDPEFDAVVKALAPSGAAQSKALIEASNPRAQRDDEGDTFIPSNKNVFQLIQEEILRLIGDNNSMDVSSRVPDDLLDVVCPRTPNNLARELDRLERNNAIPMSFDEAVRAFLTIVPAKVDRRGVVLHDRVFGSKAFDATGFRDKISGNQSIDVEIYVLEACVRHVWIDVHGRIVELDMQIPHRAGVDEYFIPLEDLKEREGHIRATDTRFRKHRAAVTGQRMLDSEEVTGEKVSLGARRKGRPRRSESGLADEREEDRILRGR